MNRWRVRWSISPLCCSGVLVGTNRILALVTASQIASASAMRRGTGLNADQTRRQLLKERQNVATLQLPADNHQTVGIHAVNLEKRLGMSRPIVQTICMGSSVESWEPLAAPTSLALSCRWRSRPQHQSRTCRSTRQVRSSSSRSLAEHCVRVRARAEPPPAPPLPRQSDDSFT
jgi:hypothetical protein